MFVTTAYTLSATAATDAAAPADAAHTTETGVPHAAEEHGAFPPFDSTHFPSQILWLAITFGVFYFLVAKMIAPRISGIIQTRESRIASDLAEASRMLAAAIGVDRAVEGDVRAFIAGDDRARPLDLHLGLERL